MENLAIAKILKPQGIRGEVKLQLYVNDPKYYTLLKQIIINNEVFEVEKLSVRQGFGYLTIKGKEKIEDVEEFRNLEIFVLRENAPKLNDDEYLIADMLGLIVIDEYNEEYGKVCQIEQYGAADVYTIIGKKGQHTFPFLHDLIKEVDFNKKLLVVYKEKLNEVLV